jgi:hypothetical protein
MHAGLSLLGLMALACASAPADAATRDFPLSGFDRVDLSGVAAVVVHTGGSYAVHADGDAEAVDALLIERRGNTLVIGHKPGVHTIHGQAKVDVSLPHLAVASASGAGSITVDRVTGPGFTANLSGTGTIRLPAVAVGQLRVSVSGAGSAVMAGRADRIDLDLSGTGSVDAKALVADGGRLSSSGVGSIHAQVNGPVDVNASGIGSVKVGGRPACTIHRSGLGSVHCA